MADTKSDEFIKSYDKYSEPIFRHCFFRLRNDRDLALDMMQETFMKTWHYIAKGNEIQNIRAFLYKTATNLIIDYSRKKKEYSLEQMQESVAPIRLSNHKGANASQQTEIKLAMENINKLDVKYKDAIIMRYVDDLPVKEIAEILGETENNISVRIHRGIEQLKKQLIREYE